MAYASIQPEWTLTGTCGEPEQQALFGAQGTVNATEYRGFPAGSLYVSAVDIDQHTGCYHVEFCKAHRLAGELDQSEFAKFPAGAWSDDSDEVTFL